MTVTPWEEARREAMIAASIALAKALKGAAEQRPDDVFSLMVAAADQMTSAALTTLSKHGYAIVPKKATEEMRSAALNVVIQPEELALSQEINAAIEAGDVLKEGK
jgi:hypothetical protein